MTMTAVAERAGASIGTLYDYFADKQTLAQSLAAQYAEEADKHWKQLLAAPSNMGKAALADLFIEGALAFAQERPAYLPLLGAPFIYSRSKAARRPLRKAFADALRRLNPKMMPDTAYLKAQIIVELIKGFLAVCKQLDAQERSAVMEDFKKLMRFYLGEITA